MQHTKKIATVTALFILLISTKLFATGAGIQAGIYPGLFINENSEKVEQFTGRILGTIRLSRIPMTAGFGLEAGKASSDFAYGFTGFADYYALDLQIKNTWNLYSGFGAEVSFLTTDFKDWGMTAGARFFAGMNWLFWDNYLELYIQQNINPVFSKDLKNNNSESSLKMYFPFETGLRFHF